MEDEAGISCLLAIESPACPPQAPCGSRHSGTDFPRVSGRQGGWHGFCAPWPSRAVCDPGLLCSVFLSGSRKEEPAPDFSGLSDPLSALAMA